MKLTRAPGSFVQHVGTLVTGNGFAQVVTLVGTVVLARLFAPDAFGLLALYVTLVSLLSVLGGGRYELAIMLPEADADAANVLNLSLLVSLAISLSCLILVAVLRFPIAALLGDPRLVGWLWSLPAILFLIDAYQCLNYWCSRMKQFRRLAFSRVFQSVGTVVCQLGLFALHVNSGLSLVGGWIFGQALATLILAAQVLSHDFRFLVASYNPLTIKNAFREYRNFPLYKAPCSFVSNGTFQLVFVILRIFSSLNVVGLYSLASRAIYLPVNLVATSMNQVFYEKAATELKFGRLESFVTRVLRVQVLVATPILIFVVLEAKLFFGRLLGSQWASGGSFVVSLAFAGYMYFITSWLDRLFDVRGRQRLSLALGVIGNSVSLIVLVAALKLTGNSTLAVASFSASEVIYSVVWLCVAYHVAEFGVKNLWSLARDAFLSAVSVTALMFPATVLLRRWPWINLAVVLLILSASLLFTLFRYIRGGYAFSTTTDRFRAFWADKSTCLNRSENQDFYAAQGQELRQLLAKTHYQNILEIGCGEGSLFAYLPFGSANYRGVDFSDHFLQMFRSRHPGVQLECADGATYCSEDQQFDLIFSNGVVQHFDPDMLANHLSNARKMMHGQSELVCACVLDKASRFSYDAGRFSGDTSIGFKRFLRSVVRRILGLDAMGYWYAPDEITALAKKNGLGVRFAPSKVYPYRFHAIMTIANNPRP